MELQYLVKRCQLFIDQYMFFIIVFLILSLMWIFNLWEYTGRFFLSIILYFLVGNLWQSFFSLWQPQGNSQESLSIWERIRVLFALSYPFLFLISIIGVWKFNLWSYLDYTFSLIVLYFLGSIALQLGFGSSLKIPRKKIYRRAEVGDSLWIEKYLERGGNPNVQSRDGVTPLYLAAEAGHLDTVKILVEHGANINQKVEGTDYLDFTPLLGAISKERDRVVEFLFENGATQDIYVSVILGDVEALKAYIEAGGDVNASRDRGTDRPYLGGQSLLHLATWKDSLAAVELLLEKGAEIDIQDSINRTPLYNAAACGSKNVARVLIERGANINVESWMHQTPLHAAAISGSVEIVQMLLDKGVDINAWGGFRNGTPLHFAIESDRVEVIKVLLERNADINATRTFSQTPLGLAKHKRKSEEIIKLLTERGAER